MADEQTDSKETIRYIQVPDNSTGWHAMVKVVTDADTNKIKDYKEDIDTLLVFAGLYSAVLSAFIIESYTSLQPDNQDIMVGLLRQIAAQNFTSGPGFLNATMPVHISPQFEPPLWAIRVNVLWFTSLILSLSAASIGMLVKQWLREYLAIPYTIPQQCIRARQYRFPALSKWKVFEIVSILPLLLQISLGLFFVGLCYFTSAIHDSVKNTTLPVVSAWAFFLLITTISPLFSPRCPYKTTFLKATLKVGRPFVASSAHYFITFICRGYKTTFLKAALKVGRSFVAPSAHYFIAFVCRGFHFIVRPFCIIIGRNKNTFKSLLIRMGPLIRMQEDFTSNAWTEEEEDSTPNAWTEEEEDVVKTEQEDVDILLSIDSFMSDDGLLPAMFNTVKQKADPADFVTFIIQIIGRRTGHDITRPLDRILDFRALSRHTWSVTTTAIASTLDHHRKGPLKEETSPWVFDAVFILFAHSSYALPSIAVKVLQDIFATRCSWDQLNTRFVSAVEDGVVRIGDVYIEALVGLSLRDSEGLLRLSSAARAGQGDIYALDNLLDIYEHFFCAEPDHNHLSIIDVLYCHRSESSLMKHWWMDILRFIHHHYDLYKLGLDTRTISPFHTDSIFRLVLTIYLVSRTDSIWGIFFLTSFHPGAEGRLKPDNPDRTLAELTIMIGESQGSIGLLVQNITAAANSYSSGAYDNEDPLKTLDIVRLCWLLLSGEAAGIRSQHRFGNVGMLDDTHVIMAKAMRRYHEKKGWAQDLKTKWWNNFPLPDATELFRDDELIACTCLTMICDWLLWEFPSELVYALWLFIPKEERGKFKILRNMYPGISSAPPSSTTDPSDLSNAEPRQAAGSENASDRAEVKTMAQGCDGAMADEESIAMDQAAIPMPRPVIERTEVGVDIDEERRSHCDTVDIGSD